MTRLKIRDCMQLLAERYELKCLEKHRRFQGVYRGIGIEVSESDEVMTLVLDSPSADLEEEAAKGFAGFRHCAEARVPSEWLASSQERTRHRCLVHITQRRLDLIGLAGFLDIPHAVARDFHEHGATEGVPPAPRGGEIPGGDASLAGEPAQQALSRKVEFRKPDLQWYLQLPFPIGWLFKQSLHLLGMLAIMLLATVGILVSRLACSERPLPERAPQPPERESYNRGVAALNRGDYDASIAEFTEAARLDPRDADAYVNWGIALAKMGRPAEACEKFAKALKINPRYADAYYSWGCALADMGKPADACEKYANAVEIDPRHANAYDNWGNVLGDMGKPAEACEKHARAVEIDPRHPMAYYNWGVALGAMGKPAEEREEYEKAVEINPRYANAYLNWGAALGKLGKRAEACEKYAKVVEINPRYAAAYFNWGLALGRMGKTAEAIEKLDKAAALDPSLKARVDELRRELMGGK